MKRAVVVGGFTTGKWGLDPVAEQICRQGLADSAETMTFLEALDNTDRLRKAAEGQLLLTHSAGALAVTAEVSPEQFVAFNGPEPRPVRELLVAGLSKTLSLQRRIVNGPDRHGAARVAADDVAQAMLHPLAHIRQIGAVSRFSTFEHLASARAVDVRVLAACSQEDIFFPFDESRDTKGVPVLPIAGSHDELLISPRQVLAAIATVQ